MILVAGMHRSGTSAAARVLAIVGCGLPRTLIGPAPDNVTGFWESRALTDLNEEILVSSGTSHLDWRPFDADWYASPAAAGFRKRAQALLHREFGDSRLFVLKDPRICRLLPFWVDAAGAAGVRPLVVLPVRNPLEVAASLSRRNRIDPFEAYLAWLRHVLDAEAGSRDLPRVWLRYEHLLTDARACLDRLGGALDVSWPREGAPTIDADLDAFLAPALRHHRSDDDRLLSNPRIPPWIRSTFAIVDRWSRDEARKKDRRTLDRIRRAFDDAAPAFNRLLAASRQELWRLTADRDRAREGVHERDARIAALTAELDAARRGVEERDARIAALAAELEARPEPVIRT